MRLVPVLVLLAGCAAPLGGAGAGGLTLEVDGTPVRLTELGDLPPQDIPITAYHDSLIASQDGGTRLSLVASTDPRSWDYGFYLSVRWDAWPPTGAPLLSALSGAPALDRLDLRVGEDRASYVAEGSALRVAFSTLEVTSEGVQVRATFEGTACRTDAPTECLGVSGSVDTDVSDYLREPGTPDPGPILF